ncbi:Ger(x)C family spore germination protein [Neobacillus mesonae]|uniref:Ger(x)C family spore germination protein n=1 Tax=Neobacillus mesonae TaxID=1193713 RepID=UPI002E229CBC|nr:Ger(x)C family spore germination protein [Neobacillus mesonae]MED4205158.1 Ger(x)C family spore germination protein [Neobacillus mesonae]
MISIRKWKVFCLVLMAVFLVGGCGFKDIDKRLFVVSIGVDLSKNSSKKYLVSLKFAIPSASKDQPNEFSIASEEADSMSEAVRILKTKVDKEIDFSHAKVIVLSEEVVKTTGNAGIYYWFPRRRDIQGIAWVAIGKPSALEVLKVKPKSEQLPSNALFMALGKDGSETPYIIPSLLFDFKYRLIERGIDPILPIIEAQKGIFEINSVGLFNKSKMILHLAPEETKMLNYLKSKEEKSAIKITKGKTKVVIDTDKVKAKYKIIRPKGKEPYISVEISVKGKLEETNRHVSNSQLWEFEKAAEKSMKKETKQLLEKIQAANVDPLGFGLRYRARSFNNDDWEQWKKIYPNITFKVDTKVQITDTGLIE